MYFALSPSLTNSAKFDSGFSTRKALNLSARKPSRLINKTGFLVVVESGVKCPNSIFIKITNIKQSELLIS